MDITVSLLGGMEDCRNIGTVHRIYNKINKNTEYWYSLKFDFQGSLNIYNVRIILKNHHRQIKFK